MSAGLMAFMLVANISAQPELEKHLQTLLIIAEDGSSVELPEGTFTLSNTLSLDAKKNVTIRGAGQGKTVLSFKNQKQGAEGIKITNAENIVLEHFTIEDSKGDLIKTQQVRGLTFRDITAQWTGEPKATNGSYALYPVQCQNVRIERCTAIGASDAGHLRWWGEGRRRGREGGKRGGKGREGEKKGEKRDLVRGERW